MLIVQNKFAIGSAMSITVLREQLCTAMKRIQISNFLYQLFH